MFTPFVSYTHGVEQNHVSIVITNPTWTFSLLIPRTTHPFCSLRPELYIAGLQRRRRRLGYSILSQIRARQLDQIKRRRWALWQNNIRWRLGARKKAGQEDARRGRSSNATEPSPSSSSIPTLTNFSSPLVRSLPLPSPFSTPSNN